MSDIQSATQACRPEPILGKPSLARGTFVTVDLRRFRAFAEDVLELETVEGDAETLFASDRRTGRNGKPFWVLEVRQVESIANPQAMLNHWGITLDTLDAVHQAHARVTAMQERFGLRTIQKVRNMHQSESFYFADADSNWWEFEYREPGARYGELPDLGREQEQTA